MYAKFAVNFDQLVSEAASRDFSASSLASRVFAKTFDILESPAWSADEKTKSLLLGSPESLCSLAGVSSELKPLSLSESFRNRVVWWFPLRPCSSR